jgi:hypothetical protein
MKRRKLPLNFTHFWVYSLFLALLLTSCNKDTDNGKTTPSVVGDVTADNWQHKVTEVYGVNVILPAEWSFATGRAEQIENVPCTILSLSSSAENAEAASLNLARQVFNATAAASPNGNFDIYGNPISELPLEDTLATLMRQSLSWYYTGADGMIAVTMMFASGTAEVYLMNVGNVENIGTVGKPADAGSITIHNLPAAEGAIQVIVYNYSGAVNDPTGYVNAIQTAIEKGILAEGEGRNSSISLYSQSGYGGFSGSGSYAVAIYTKQSAIPMFYGQVRFTNGNATVDYWKPTYDPAPCEPYHTGGEMIKSAIPEGAIEGWADAAWGVAGFDFSLTPPTVDVAYGYTSWHGGVVPHFYSYEKVNMGPITQIYQEGGSLSTTLSINSFSCPETFEWANSNYDAVYWDESEYEAMVRTWASQAGVTLTASDELGYIATKYIGSKTLPRKHGVTGTLEIEITPSIVYANQLKFWIGTVSISCSWLYMDN